MPEKGQKQLSIIERLRAQYPNRNICDIAVNQLDQPTDMVRFLIEYAQELGRTSTRPEIRANPFDTAVKLVDYMATLCGRKIWHELIDTGTVQEVPDHSLDWLITPFRTKRRFEEAKKIRQNEPSIKDRTLVEFSRTQKKDSSTSQIKPRSAGASYTPEE